MFEAPYLFHGSFYLVKRFISTWHLTGFMIILLCCSMLYGAYMPKVIKEIATAKLTCYRKYKWGNRSGYAI